MRKTIVTALAAFLLGAITTGVVASWAQPAQPGGPQAADGSPMMRGSGMAGPGMTSPGMMGPGMTGPGMMGPGMGPAAWMQRMREHHARRSEMMKVFALFDRPDDRKLSPADVQKIAEAFLLWNGNHTWKIINVRPDGDAIAFDPATADGSVIARYDMDPKTGRPARKG